MELYRKALVCGLGSSGVAAARLLVGEGARVTAIDRADTSALRQTAAELASLGVSARLGPNTTVPDEPYDVAVVSPGLTLNSPWLSVLADRGVPLLSELELGWSRFRGRTIAVTGSNGKSTAVKWLAESLAAGGARAAPAGNYGPPAAQVVRERPDLEWLVLEVSSFQLETTRDFRPDIGVVLNVFPNHLDRHGSRAAYLALKARLFARARFGDTCLVNAGLLQELKPLVGTGRGVWRTFDCAPPADYVYRAGAVEHDGRVRARFDGTYFGNDVLGLTAAAVVAALDAAGLPPAAAETVARRFEPLPHRMQVVAVRDGVTFINDSKATNLTAMAAALRMTGGGVRLIAGGLAKESDFEFVRPVLAEKARGVYLIGQAAVAMAAAWADTVACQVCGTLEAAVAQAWRDAAPGECVLLAPACASFDQFRNYEERGNCFMKYVENLSGRTA